MGTHCSQVSGSVPIDVYYSASRSDYWALASETSRSQAEKVGENIHCFIVARRSGMLRR